MVNRTVLTNPNQELRKRSELVLEKEFGSTELQELINDLIDTMRVENGVGIAAPQIGVLKRVIIVDIGQGPQVYVNPVITHRSFKKIESEEGCLSVPGVYGIVKRHKKVTMKARALDGRAVVVKAEDFPAIVYQHETDHLNGILFIDKVSRYTQPPKNVL
jgi:peptide deformylase